MFIIRQCGTRGEINDILKKLTKFSQTTIEIQWRFSQACDNYYSDVIMSAMASQINGISVVYSTVCSGANQRKHKSSALLAFVSRSDRWIPRITGQ